MQPQDNGDLTLKAVPPDPEIVAWLWSAEGLAWSKVHIRDIRHGAGAFAEIKLDHECTTGIGMRCSVGGTCYPDEWIKAELRRYGISGVPGEWKQAQERYDVY